MAGGLSPLAAGLASSDLRGGPTDLRWQILPQGLQPSLDRGMGQLQESLAAYQTWALNFWAGYGMAAP